jgi:hypothetical protein
MADDFAGWEKHADGSIKLNPLTGWDALVAFGMAVVIRPHFARSDGELRRGVSHKLPLVLTPSQARELAEVLLRTADRAEQPAGSGETKQ